MTRESIAGLLFWICMLQMGVAACAGRPLSLMCAAAGMIIAKLVVGEE